MENGLGRGIEKGQNEWGEKIASIVLLICVRGWTGRRANDDIVHCCVSVYRASKEVWENKEIMAKREGAWPAPIRNQRIK